MPVPPYVPQKDNVLGLPLKKSVGGSPMGACCCGGAVCTYCVPPPQHFTMTRDSAGGSWRGPGPTDYGQVDITDNVQLLPTAPCVWEASVIGDYGPLGSPLVLGLRVTRTNISDYVVSLLLGGSPFNTQTFTIACGATINYNHDFSEGITLSGNPNINFVVAPTM